MTSLSKFRIYINQGFYDKNLDFVGLQNIHLVASMNPSTTVGRFALSTRFTANVRVAYMAYPEKAR